MDIYQKPVVRVRPNEGVALVLADGTEVLMTFGVGLSLGQLLVQELGGLQDAPNDKKLHARRTAAFLRGQDLLDLYMS